MNEIARALGLANLACLLWKTQPEPSRGQTLDAVFAVLESALADVGLTPAGLEQEIAKASNLGRVFVKAEAARYRAALEDVSNHRGTPTAGGYSVCDWCGVSVDAHRPDCAAAIAHRALHPEEEA